MWVREPCSVWLLGGQGGHKGMLWGKELGRTAGFQEVGFFSAVSRVTGPQGLLPWLQTNRSSLSYWKSLPGCGGHPRKEVRSRRGRIESGQWLLKNLAAGLISR